MRSLRFWVLFVLLSLLTACGGGGGGTTAGNTPVDPADYPVNPLTGILDSKAFAAKVAAIFPNGVCDYSKPPADDVPTQTWLQYGTADQVIYGGAPISDDASGDSRQGWAAPAFDVGIGQP